MHLLAGSPVPAGQARPRGRSPPGFHPDTFQTQEVQPTEPKPACGSNADMRSRRPKTRTGTPGYGMVGDLPFHAPSPQLHGAPSPVKRPPTGHAVFRDTRARGDGAPLAGKVESGPEAGDYRALTAFEGTGAGHARLPFRLSSKSSSWLVDRETLTHPNPGTYDTLREGLALGAAAHPADASGLTLRPQSAYCSAALDRFGDKVHHAAEQWTPPPPGSYGEGGRPGPSVGDERRTFNASHRAQVALAKSARMRASTRTRHLPQTLLLAISIPARRPLSIQVPSPVPGSSMLGSPVEQQPAQTSSARAWRTEAGNLGQSASKQEPMSPSYFDDDAESCSLMASPAGQASSRMLLLPFRSEDGPRSGPVEGGDDWSRQFLTSQTIEPVQLPAMFPPLQSQGMRRQVPVSPVRRPVPKPVLHSPTVVKQQAPLSDTAARSFFFPSGSRRDQGAHVLGTALPLRAPASQVKTDWVAGSFVRTPGNRPLTQSTQSQKRAAYVQPAPLPAVARRVPPAR